MDQYRTAESWSGVPGAIAPADGNAVAQALRPEGFSSADAAPMTDQKSLNPERASYSGNDASQQDAGATDAPVDLGPNNERLDDVKPELVNALRELARQYRQEGVVARRHEIRRIRQARLFWQGLQYA